MSKASPRAQSTETDSERWKILIRAYFPDAHFGSEVVGAAADLREFDVFIGRFYIEIVFHADFRSPYFYFVVPWQLFGYEDLTEENLVKRLKYIKENVYG